jgi:hypothetical protein|nr:MAG TPA: hypothetical protein [Caudoviricetes sp.]
MIDKFNSFGGFSSVRFVVPENPKAHQHELDYPLAGECLTVVIENNDAIQRANLEFCKNRLVWIDCDEARRRRANVIFEELQKFENQPRLIFTDFPDGLQVFNPKTQGHRDFFKEAAA